MNERIGNRRELALTAVNIGYGLYDQEEYEQAHEYFSRAVERAIEVRDAYVHMHALIGMGRVLLVVQQADAAERAVQQGLFIALQLHLPSWELACHIALAEVALQRGDLEAALAEYHKGAVLVADTESEEYGRFQRLEAKLAMAQGDAKRAIQLLTANQAFFTRIQNQPEAKRTGNLLHEYLKATT